MKQLLILIAAIIVLVLTAGCTLAPQYSYTCAPEFKETTK